MGGIIWVASYPKSGNTWLRIFFTNLLQNGEEPASINDLEGGAIASSRALFDQVTGIESSDLTGEEIERLRPDVYEKMAAELQEVLFFKVHDAYTYGEDGRPLLAAAGSRAIYLIRNPLDVAVSFADHLGYSIKETINRMADAEYAQESDPEKLSGQFRQRLMSWSAHVRSWLEAPIPILVLRFEDMKQRPLESFSRAARFAGLPDEPARVRQALAFSDFKELQRQEQESGFKERSPNAKRFFREGSCGTWRRVLNSKQVARIVREHLEVMQQFGYLTSEGEPL
jgi:aryl sulfotransferase